MRPVGTPGSDRERSLERGREGTEVVKKTKRVRDSRGAAGGVGGTAGRGILRRSSPAP